MVSAPIKIKTLEKEEKKMRKRDKMIKKVEIEHADGSIEKLRMSYPLIQILADRLIKGGWPFCGITINGQTIASKPDPCMLNVYRDTNGKEVII